ncbi:MAG: ABC-F family ATP-binding cassette domain-containing protein [Flavobacteriales bacterium]
MNILSVENISRSYGEKILFENISFGLEHGEKTALIARNGAGKTTLLRILNGLDSPDSGKVTYRQGTRVAYLSQDLRFPNDVTAAAYISKNKRVTDVLLGKETSDDLNDDEKAEFGNIISTCGKLGLHNLNAQVNSLSGGNQKRLALAQVLLSDADLYILDEPTNHLDVEMIEWLEGFLTQSNKAVFLVTHDRYFLDKVCDQILELDDNTLYRYRGDFGYFLEKKAQRLEIEKSHLSKMKNLFRRELDWMRKSPKARTTKSKSRQDSFYEIEDEAGKKINEDKISFNVNVSRIGSKILELHNVTKSFGEKKIIDKFNYVFKKGEKIGLVGRNGTGKTTFLKLVLGEIEPDSGKVVLGDTIVPGYFSQHVSGLNPSKRVLETLKEFGDFIPMAGGKKLSASQLLEEFLFPPELHYTFIEKLSGGEKRRLQLLTILIKNPNFLILDEPTNDLDIDTLTVLEDYLGSFEGCVLIVTHDRFFMDRITDHLFVFDGNGNVTDITGNYTEYRKQRKELEKKNKNTDTTITSEPKKDKKASYKEKFEFEQLEKQMSALEDKKRQLEEQLAVHGLDHDKLTEISTQIGAVNRELDEKSLRWLELADKFA